MRKKILVLGLATVMAFSFTACGGDKEPAKQETEAKKSDTDKLNELKGNDLSESMKTIEDMGYKATYQADGVDFTDFIDDVKDDYLVGDMEVNEKEKTVVVNLDLASNKEAEDMEKALKKKLEVGSAWAAAEKYGQEEYGDEFDLNYLTGNIDDSAYDEDTWFLKAECEVGGEEKTCEAKVTGTTDNPEVVSFDVY